MSCSICNQSIDDNQVLLPCLHGFCFKCFGGPKCTVCNKEHGGRVVPVIKLFPIPTLLDVLKNLGFKYVTLGEAAKFLVIDPERCNECTNYYGKPFVCIDLHNGQHVYRNLCSQCGVVRYSIETDQIQGNAEKFFEQIENRLQRVDCAPNYHLINVFHGKSIETAVTITKKMFSDVAPQAFVPEQSCNRLLQVIHDCQPHQQHYTVQYNAAMNQILRQIVPHCLRWHKIDNVECVLKHFSRSAFGFAHEGERRKLNLTLVAWFLYFMRNKTMFQFDWFGNSQYPDDSYYVCQAVLQNKK